MADDPFVVGDVDYGDAVNLLELRGALIGRRNAALGPDGFDAELAVMMSHAIGVLGALAVERRPDLAGAVAAQAKAIKKMPEGAGTIEGALRNVVRAWEKLPRGHHSIEYAERWLRSDMKPAIDRGRRVLGIPTEPPE